MQAVLCGYLASVLQEGCVVPTHHSSMLFLGSCMLYARDLQCSCSVFTNCTLSESGMHCVLAVVSGQRRYKVL
jgi:hypothetical protein